MALTEAQQEFLNKTYSEGRAAGLTDTQARLLATQAAHESAFGTRTGGDFNYWGIKTGNDWTGDTANVTTREYGQGVINDKFRSYPDPASALADRIGFMQDKFPDAANAESFDDAIAGLSTGKHGVYATDLLDPNDPYGKSLRWINNQIDPSAYGGAGTQALRAAGKGITGGVDAANTRLREWFAPRPQTMTPGLRERDFTKLPPLRPAGSEQTAEAAIIKALGGQASEPEIGYADPTPTTRTVQGSNAGDSLALDPAQVRASTIPFNAGYDPSVGSMRVASNTANTSGLTPLQSAQEKLRIAAANRTSAPGAGVTQSQRDAMSAVPARGPGEVAIPANVVPASVQRDLPLAIAANAELQQQAAQPQMNDIGTGATTGQLDAFRDQVRTSAPAIDYTVDQPRLTPADFVDPINTAPPQGPVSIPNTPENMPLGMQLNAGPRDSVAQEQLARDVLANATPQVTIQQPVQGPPQLLGPVSPGIVKQGNPMQQIMTALVGSQPRQRASTQQTNPVIQALEEARRQEIAQRWVGHNQNSDGTPLSIFNN